MRASEDHRHVDCMVFRKVDMSEIKCEAQKRGGLEMGLKALGESKMEKIKSSVVVPASRSRMKLWMIRATTTVLLWTCVVQLTALGESWGPRVLKGWPSCLSQESAVLDDKAVQPRVLPPKSESSFLFSLAPFLVIRC